MRKHKRIEKRRGIRACAGREQEAKRLDWRPPHVAEAGTYSVVFYFVNDPGLKWNGLPLGKHDPEAMKQVQKSHKCLLVSNELKLVVKPKE